MCAPWRMSTGAVLALVMGICARAPGASLAKTSPGRIIPLLKPADNFPIPSDTPIFPAPALLSRPSPRNLLGLDRQSPHGLPKLALQHERVLRMLILRVQFVKEDPDDPTTTGDGTFDLRDSVAFKAERGHLFDSSPHDSAYFGKHIEALSRYWHAVSNGKVSVEATVYPPDPRGAYTLPQPMAHYGEQPPQYGLTEFYVDAFQAADTTNPEIDFSTYDVYCVFHAGVDRQGDIGFPPTPNDLFTGFILLGRPIPVDFGLYEITEGLIMPETAAQDNRIIVLNAVLAHEFGHQLGLIDLYSTQTFISQIGNFSLMDNNGANVGGEIEINGQLRLLFGSLPVFPDAWSRAYLGFVAADTVMVDPAGFVYAAELEAEPNQVALVPITGSEYFLIENRRVDIDGQPITNILADSTTNVILGPVDDQRRFNREYDYPLPGDGILIWHVDESVALDDVFPDDSIPNNFAANTLQWNFDRRFISLVEADMVRSFRGTEFSNLGTASDMFAAPGRRSFSPRTAIPSETNSGARTGITIEVKSPAQIVMDFSVSNDQTLPGFPVWCGTQEPRFSPGVVDIDGDGAPEVFVGCGNRVLGWRFDGSPLFENTVMDTVVSFNGDTVFHRAAVVARIPAPLATPPLISRMDGTGEPNLALGDTTDTIRVWRLTDFNHDGFADSVFTMRSTYHLSGPAVALDRPGSFTKDIAFGLTGGVFVINAGTRDSLRFVASGRTAGFAGNELNNTFYLRDFGVNDWVLQKVSVPSTFATLRGAEIYGPMMGDLDRDGVLDLVCAGSDGTIWAFDTALAALPGFPVTLGGEVSSAPVLGDVDQDGFLEIVVSGSNEVFALNYNGTPAENFPITVDRHHPTGPLSSAPIIIDPPGQRAADIITVTSNGEVVPVHPREFGQADSPSWPVGPPGVGSCAFGYNSATRQAAIWALGGDGFLYGLAIPDSVPAAKGIFSQEGYGPERRFVYPIDSLPELPADSELLAESSVFAWPNPVHGDVVHIRYRLGVPAAVEVAIYDVAGNVIGRLADAGEAHTENDIAWQCRDVASGVYFCRLEARADSGARKVVFCPVAITR